MFLPNSSCELYRRNSTPDVYNAYSFQAGVTVRCSIVTLDVKVAKTSVRADTSASKGRAEEEIGLTRILFPANTEINEYDIVVVDGQVAEVIRIFPRRNVLGRVDHLQVDFRRGALPA